MKKTVEHAFRLHDQEPICNSFYWQSGWTIPKYKKLVTCKKCKARMASSTRGGK